MSLKSLLAKRSLKKKRQQASSELQAENGESSLRPKYKVGDLVYIKDPNDRRKFEEGKILRVHNRLNGQIGYYVDTDPEGGSKYDCRKEIREDEIDGVVNFRQAREEMKKGEMNSKPIITQPIITQPQPLTSSSEKTRRVKVLYQHDTGLIYVIRVLQDVKPLQEDYVVRLQGNRIATVEKMEMYTSTLYTVFFGANKLCGCTGFKMSADRKTCRHIEALVKLTG